MSADLKVSPTSWIHQLKQQVPSTPTPIDVRPPVRGKCTVEHVTTDAKRGNNQNTLVANIGDGTDAINFLLVEAGCPAHLRVGIDCIVGLAGDRVEWFEAPDATVGMRARVGGELMSRDAACKWVQRWRKALIEWQQTNNLALIECSPGGQAPDGTRYPSRYKVNLLALAAATVEEARGSNLWKRGDLSRALELAAQTIIEDSPETPAYKQRFRAPRRDDNALLKRNPKMAKTLLGEVARILHKRGEDFNTWFDEFAESIRQDVNVHTIEDKDQWTNLSTVEPEESHGGGILPPTEAQQAASDVCAAVDLLSSVGASEFLATMKDETTEKVTSDNVTLRELVTKLPEYVERNADGIESFIVRPKDAALIQLDDCTSAERDHVAPAAFMVIETSEANYQTWLALPEETSDGERKRVRDRLLRGEWRTSANVGAGGALRFPGSLNCKPERRRADGSLPRVRLVQSAYGRFTSEAELEAAGLLGKPAPPCDSSLFNPPRPMDKNVHCSIPSYEKCLQSVELKRNGKPDRSKADLLFAITCLNWKVAFDETVALLKRFSAKAKSRRDNYAEHTVRLALSKIGT
jgi:hypothetical protein